MGGAKNSNNSRGNGETDMQNGYNAESEFSRSRLSHATRRTPCVASLALSRSFVFAWLFSFFRPSGKASASRTRADSVRAVPLAAAKGTAAVQCSTGRRGLASPCMIGSLVAKLAAASSES